MNTTLPAGWTLLQGGGAAAERKGEPKEPKQPLVRRLASFADGMSPSAPAPNVLTLRGIAAAGTAAAASAQWEVSMLVGEDPTRPSVPIEARLECASASMNVHIVEEETPARDAGPNTQETGSEPKPNNPVLSIGAQDVPGFAMHYSVRWLPVAAGDVDGTLLELEALKKYDDGKKDDKQKTWGTQSINPHKSCQLYFITPMSPPNCPYPFTDPITIPVMTMLNLMIKSIVGLTIPPIIQLSPAVWNLAGMLPVLVGDKVMLETESRTRTGMSDGEESGLFAEGNPLAQQILKATSRAFFSRIFAPTGDIKKTIDMPLLPEVVIETELILNKTLNNLKASYDLYNLERQSDRISSFLETDVTASAGKMQYPKKGTWQHNGKVNFPKATNAIVSACKNSVAKAVEKVLLPSKLGRLAKLVIREVHDRVSYVTLRRVQDAVVHDMVHTLPQHLSQAVGANVAEIAEVEAVERLTERIIAGVTRTLTRSLTHSVSLSLVVTLSQSGGDLAACHACKTYNIHCGTCSKGQQAGLVRQTNHYANFYSNYFAEYFLDDPAASVYQRKKK